MKNYLAIDFYNELWEIYNIEGVLNYNTTIGLPLNLLDLTEEEIPQLLQNDYDLILEIY